MGREEAKSFQLEWMQALIKKAAEDAVSGDFHTSLESLKDGIENDS